MKQVIYGIAGILAISASIPAVAASPAMQAQAQPPAVETKTITRTIVVKETPIFGQQIVTALDSKAEASNFRNLMAANGLSTSLRDNADGYTAFVPLNRAFEGTSITIPNGVAADGTINTQVRGLLEDHIVDSKFDVNIMHGTRDKVSSLTGKNITISKVGREYYANGHLIVDRWHDPEGIIYFTDSFVTEQGSFANTAIYNPADVKK